MTSMVEESSAPKDEQTRVQLRKQRERGATRATKRSGQNQAWPGPRRAGQKFLRRERGPSLHYTTLFFTEITLSSVSSY